MENDHQKQLANSNDLQVRRRQSSSRSKSLETATALLSSKLSQSRRYSLIEQQNLEDNSVIHHSSSINTNNDFLKDVAGVAGNILEWYDFSFFGCMADVIGDVFFPPQAGAAALVESFLVYGGAFLMRPIGGMWIGYIGDTYGRKVALETSIFLMALATFATGCLPSYATAGAWAYILLIVTRLMQGVSVGGQLVSSLVFTLESKPHQHWGWYGSWVMNTSSFGSLLGGLVSAFLRAVLSTQQLQSWGWRLPFLSGILISLCGLYLKYYCDEEDKDDCKQPSSFTSHDGNNPLRMAFSSQNIRLLLAAGLVTLSFAAGGHTIYLWLPTYMTDLIDPPVPHAFFVSSASLFVGHTCFFPVAGWLSDRFNRKRIMTLGIVGMSISAPICISIISTGNPYHAFVAQTWWGINFGLLGAPICAWLVEAFPSHTRLTSVAIGYNVAQSIAGGSSPALATILTAKWGGSSVGYYLMGLAATSLVGLWVVAPNEQPYKNEFQKPGHAVPTMDSEKGIEMELEVVQ